MVLTTDITDDISKTMYANLIDKVDVPDYVKSAEVETEKSVKHLDPRAFADTIQCKLPLNTKASCWTSALYLYGHPDNNASSRPSRIETNLFKHAEIWGIEEDINLIKQAFAPVDTPVEYALSFDHRGTRIDRCPCHTPELAKKSCDWLQDHRNHFPINAQIKAAHILINKAGGYDSVPDASRDYLGALSEADTFATAPNITIAGAIKERLVSVKKSQWGDLGNELLKVANDLTENPYSLVKGAKTIQDALEAFDVQFNLQQKWGESLTHPVDACFTVTRQKAAKATAGLVKLMNGNYFDLNKAALSDLETGLKQAGDDFLAYAKPDGLNLDIDKVKEILPTIPAPDANRFQRAFPTTTFNEDIL
jgi:hypothetical protein